MARVMLFNKDIPQKFLGEAVNTSCHIGNRIFFQMGTKKTSYEIWNEKKPKVKYVWYLAANVSFSMIEKILGILMPKVMKEFFLGTL